MITKCHISQIVAVRGKMEFINKFENWKESGNLEVDKTQILIFLCATSARIVMPTFFLRYISRFVGTL